MMFQCAHFYCGRCIVIGQVCVIEWYKQIFIRSCKLNLIYRYLNMPNTLHKKCSQSHPKVLSFQITRNLSYMPLKAQLHEAIRRTYRIACNELPRVASCVASPQRVGRRRPKFRHVRFSGDSWCRLSWKRPCSHCVACNTWVAHNELHATNCLM